MKSFLRVLLLFVAQQTVRSTPCNDACGSSCTSADNGQYSITVDGSVRLVNCIFTQVDGSTIGFDTQPITGTLVVQSVDDPNECPSGTNLWIPRNLAHFRDTYDYYDGGPYETYYRAFGIISHDDAQQGVYNFPMLYYVNGNGGMHSDDTTTVQFFKSIDGSIPWWLTDDQFKQLHFYGGGQGAINGRSVGSLVTGEPNFWWYGNGMRLTSMTSFNSFRFTNYLCSTNAPFSLPTPSPLPPFPPPSPPPLASSTTPVLCEGNACNADSDCTAMHGPDWYCTANTQGGLSSGQGDGDCRGPCAPPAPSPPSLASPSPGMAPSPPIVVD